MERCDMEQILCKAKSTGADFSELYLEDRSDTIIKNKNQRIQGVTSLHIHGAGIYLLKGTESVYVYSNDTSKRSLLQLAETAASLLPFVEKQGSPKGIVFTQQRYPMIHPIEIYPTNVGAGAKVAVIKDMERTAHAVGPKIETMEFLYFDQVQHVTIANSEGLYTEDTRVESRLRVRGSVSWNGKVGFEFNDFVRPYGFETFRDQDYLEFVKNTILKMEQGLKTKPIKSCAVPVVFEAGDCGVFWHEACGHNLESGAASGGIFAGNMGKPVASSKITLIDDGSIPGMNGSQTIDDEGHVTQKNVLIEQGILKGFLCDRKGGRELGCGSTGSGRRQSYTFAPCSRMHNTYLAAGTDDDQEMISSIDQGLLVTRLGGGSSGDHFSIAVKEAYWIRKGEIAERVGNFTLSGPSREIIHRVDRVGKTLVPDLGGSYCGASSGLVPTTAYGPRFRVSCMNVGGTQT